MSLESFEDYKAFMKADIESNRHLKGYQGQLAKAAGCHPSFLSQILNSSIHLTPDHGARMAEFWAFTHAETEYFLALVNLARAASPALRESLRRTIFEFRKQRTNLANRFQQPKLEGLEAQSLYYSSWAWSAVHVLTSINEYQDEKSICARLNLTATQVKKILTKLVEMDLVIHEGKKWKATSRSLHLPKESSLLATHLQNWRQRAVVDSVESDSASIHYSAVHALSKSDIEKIRALILPFLEKTREVVAPSPEEEMVCLNLDFFVV